MMADIETRGKHNNSLIDLKDVTNLFSNTVLSNNSVVHLQNIFNDLNMSVRIILTY